MLPRPTTLIVYATLAMLVAFALAGVLLVQPGPESTQRLGLLFGVIGTAIAAVVSAIRADQAAQQTNGTLDARIHDAVTRANAGQLVASLGSVRDRIEEHERPGSTT